MVDTEIKIQLPYFLSCFFFINFFTKSNHIGRINGNIPLQIYGEGAILESSSCEDLVADRLAGRRCKPRQQAIQWSM